MCYLDDESVAIVSKHKAQLHAYNYEAGHIHLKDGIKINLYQCDGTRKMC